MDKILAGVLAGWLLLGTTACGTAAPKPAPFRGEIFPAPTGNHSGPRWVYVPPGNTVRSYQNRFGGVVAPGKISKVPTQSQAPGRNNGYWLFIGPPRSAPR